MSPWMVPGLRRVLTLAVSLFAVASFTGSAVEAAPASKASSVRVASTARGAVVTNASAISRASKSAAVAQPARLDPALLAAIAAEQARRQVWDRMAFCETRQNWSMRGASYSGGLGIANSTWTAFGGQEFASNAGLATRDQQIVIAERIRVRYGYHAWGCARTIGV